MEFRNYFRKDGIPSNVVTGIFEDKNNRIGCISSTGLSFFDGQKFIFYPAPDDKSNISFWNAEPFEPVADVLIGAFDNNLQRTRLMVFNEGTYSAYSEFFPAIDTLDIIDYVNIKEDLDLLLLDRKGRLLSWQFNRLKQISSIRFEFLLQKNGKSLIYSKDNKTFEYSKGKLIAISENRGEVPDDIFLRNFFRKTDFLSLYKKGNLFRLKIPNGRPTDYIIDKEGNAWFAGEKNISRLISTAFESISSEDNLSENIWALAEDKKGHLWFGSLYGDLQEFDGEKLRLRNEYKVHFPHDVCFYKGSRTLSNGDIYFSTNMGVLIWNGISFSRLKGMPHDCQVCCIYEDVSDKSVFFGTSLGVYQLKDGKLKLYPEFTGNRLGVIEGIVREGNGKYWFSGHKGMLLFDGKNPVRVIDSILPATFTYTLDKDSRGGLWITSEEGLFFRDSSSGKFLHGLPAEINRPANSLIMMDSSTLLVGRTTDICIINLDLFYKKDAGYFRIYDKSDGFSGDDCLDNGIIKDKSGRFLILTSNGVVILNPQELKINPYPPRVYITDIEQQTDSLSWLIINEPGLFYELTGELRLNRKQNTLRISFTGISTTNPEKVTYQYRLSGYEEKWSVKSPARKAYYEKLSPGFYTFQVKAFNSDGIGNEEPVSISFRIRPAFWQTLLFRITMFLLIVFVSVVTTWYTMKYIQNKKREQERLQSELTRLHMESVIKQFDPHFTFNVLSSVGSLIMKGEKEAAYDYLLKLSGLLRSVINEGSAMIKPLSEELDFVTKYCEVQKLRFKERFDWNIVVETGVNLQREIPKLTIQIFVENAIRHGIENKRGGGRVDINLSNNGSGLEITVTDTGIGRTAAKNESSAGTGKGIKLVTGLFDQMNVVNKSRAIVEITDLMDNDKKATGTRVKVFIPDVYCFGSAENN